MFTKSFKNQRKNNVFDPKTEWKSSQFRSKTTPRGDNFALKVAPLFGIDFCSVVPPKMPPFGDPFCSQNHSKKLIKIKVPQKLPKTTPISPQDGPRSPQEAPRGSQESPKKPKKHPKRPHKHQKESLKERLRNQKGTASGLNKAKRHPCGN